MSKKVPDLTGEQFGRWTVLQCAGRGKHGELQYKCRCECGTERIIRRSSLTSGNSKSCGCLSKDIAKKLNTSHGATHTRLYRIWAGIIQRCCNSRKRYEWEKYGGRGISVCDEWKNSFENFQKWALSNGYNEHLSIDRIDVNRGCFPENCRWATAKEQGNNTRSCRKITYKGKTKTMRGWEEEMGLSKGVIYWRLKHGWSEKEAIETKHRLCMANGMTA